MALYLIATTTVIIVSHYVAGLSGVQTFITAAALVPVLFAASRIGMRISSRIPGALFTNVVYGVLVLLAVLLLIKK